jgi:hypothetical protein
MQLNRIQASQISPECIFTLGPRGTDSQAVAATLSDNVILVDSFERAVRLAIEHGAQVLIPCGYVSGTASDRQNWVDLHFQFQEQLEPVRVLLRKTKPMCAAIRAGTNLSPDRVSIHPTTTALANRYFPGSEIVCASSKPAAVQACVSGETNGCIGSLDVVEEFDVLSVLAVFRPKMIWVLYAPVKLGGLCSHQMGAHTNAECTE